MAIGLGEGSLLGDRYRLERMLGTGGMATVWLAQDERLGRPVAVKILADTLAADPAYLRRFRREARLAAGLSHPNLVKVYDFGGEGDRPYLAMEYVEGGSLADRITAGTARGLDSTRLARELLEALVHIHSAGIVHRDVKPGNVLIVPPGGTAKLADFGIAQPEGATRLTSTGLVVGTRSYMAPEVGRGEPATVPSDLYSCGMVLREAIGEEPSPELANLVSHLCDEDPGRRPQSASQALALIAEHGESAGPEATTATTATAATEPLPPDRTARTIPIGARQPESRRGLKRMLMRPLPLAGVALLALIVIGVILLSGGNDSSSTSGRAAGEAPQQTPTAAEEATGQDEPGGAIERPKASGKPNEESPSKAPPGKVKSGKSEGDKSPKAPPGKAKGLSKD